MDTPEWSDYLKSFESATFAISEEKLTKYAIIIEFREDPRLILVIKNFMSMLAPLGWGLIVFHGTSNSEFVKNALLQFPRIIFGEVPYENIDAGMYSQFLCSVDFWRAIKRFGCQHALIFQMDTVLLRPDLDKFLEYDYVGAPWKNPWLVQPDGLPATGIEVGNGGLSLRRVDAMFEIVQKYPRVDPQFYNEDIYFSYWTKVGGYRLPTREIAAEFSIETMWHPNPCGMHQPHIQNMPEEEFKKLFARS